MIKISDCFVGQTQTTIDNIQEYVRTYPLCILGFSFIKASIINHLKMTYDSIELWMEIIDRSHYCYIEIDNDYKFSIHTILNTIDNYIKFNKLDDFIKISNTTEDNTLVLSIKVE